jgi:hypothetical protein
MTIIEKHVYRSATLPEAPERVAIQDAEQDEQRGLAVSAYMSVLSTLTPVQWATVWETTRDPDWTLSAASVLIEDTTPGAPLTKALGAARDAARATAWGVAWETARGADLAAAALVVRHLISPEEFALLTAPMVAAGVDFDSLAGTP